MNPQITIAIADDHFLVRRGFIDIINEFPDCKVVIEAANGIDLIAKIAIAQIKPDVAVIDISMPRMDGYATLKELKKRYPSMKFLALSGYDLEHCIIRMIQLGANGFVSKNNYDEQFYDAITSVYYHGYYYSNVASEKAFNIVKNNMLPELTDREIEYIKLAAQWKLSYYDIASMMNVDKRTIESYQQIVGNKLDIHTRVGIATFAIQSGLMPVSTH